MKIKIDSYYSNYDMDFAKDGVHKTAILEFELSYFAKADAKIDEKIQELGSSVMEHILECNSTSYREMSTHTEIVED